MTKTATPSDPPPRLPQELVDHIIDHLADQWHLADPDSQSRETLGQCMLVSRSFLTSVRRQLFRRLRLSEKRTDALNCHEEPAANDWTIGFLEVLKGDPLRGTPHPLAAQVRGIKLEMHKIPSSGTHSPESEKSTAENIQEWNDKRVQLYHILKATSNLDAFALEFVFPMDAHSIHLGIFIAIEKVCHSIRITRLQFTNIYHFPVDLLAMCVNLRELRLSAVWIARPEGLESLTGTDSKPASTILPAMWSKDSLRYLEILDTRRSVDVIKAIKEVASKTSSPFSHLKKLQLGLHPSSGPNSLEWEVLKNAAQSLECLCIRGVQSVTLTSKVNQPFPGNICLSDFTSLRTLKLRTSLQEYDILGDLQYDLLPFLPPHTRAPTTIESIYFDLYFTSLRDVDKLQHSDSVADIDSLLTSGLYPCLKMVKVRYLFRSHYFWRWLVAQSLDALAGLHMLVNRVFPQVSASESIKLEISSEPFSDHDDEYELQW